MKTMGVLEKEIELYQSRTRRSKEMWQKARKVMPMGTASNSRMYEPYPIYIDHAEGSRVWDADGNEYIDHNLSFGAIVVGHRNPTVMNAVSNQLRIGTMYGMSHGNECELAEEICRRFPFLDRVRFSNSSTEHERANWSPTLIHRADTYSSILTCFSGHTNSRTLR